MLILTLEVLLVAEVISIKNENIRHTHDTVVEKVKDFFVMATKRFEEFFSRDEEAPEQIDSNISYEDNTPMDSGVPHFIKASQRSLKGGDK